MSPLQARLAARLSGRVPARADDAGLARAAVAVVVVPDPDALLLIRRAERPGDPWSGQMGFPGGRSSAADSDLVDTAVRETREELGFALTRADLVAPLDDVAPRSPHLPPLMVRPFLFFLGSRPAVEPNAEVADHLWVEWRLLLDPAVYRPFTYRFGDLIREFPAYHVAPVPVWGMTERILAPLVQLVAEA